MRPETRYAFSSGVNIAYQVLGTGPHDLVFVLGWVSNIEDVWEEAAFARFLTGFPLSRGSSYSTSAAPDCPIGSPKCRASRYGSMMSEPSWTPRAQNVQPSLDSRKVARCVRCSVPPTRIGPRRITCRTSISPFIRNWIASAGRPPYRGSRKEGRGHWWYRGSCRGARDGALQPWRSSRITSGNGPGSGRGVEILRAGFARAQGLPGRRTVRRKHLNVVFKRRRVFQ